MKNMGIEHNVIGWVVGNIAWEILFFVVIILVPTIWTVSRVSKKILLRNRAIRIPDGVAFGKHTADRLIDIWYSKNPLDSSSQHCYKFGSASSEKVTEAIDKELEDLKLISRNSGPKAASSPIKSFRNQMIVFVIKFWLIHIVGDDVKYYSNLER